MSSAAADGLPAWLTVALGVLAVVGTIVGALGAQMIAARRVQQREDIRWQREREERNEERRHQLRLSWRERRLEAYSEFLAAMEELEGQVVARSGLTIVTNRPIKFEEIKFEEHVNRALAALKIIQVIGSPELGAACLQLLKDADFHRLEFEGPMGMMDRTNRVFAWNSSRRQLLQSVRIELDVEMPEPGAAPQLNPGPPSATAS
ncbi:hypothetical protein [Umezawaea sp. Da 62-37]|uniref:hypothetical protein n=1 Tax=Umezawaea sp. Da 62-37 TaxID=3075927 RepID=UPI0028F6CF19|nr:hypothetical protein [Umezawaea sp. Da 62-37]WNV86579.1 hypothetical protein RM788_52125 [Umezawaea sp. Da 62-37]